MARLMAAGSVNHGLQLHDRAEKRRQADPAAACALYREAISAYQVPLHSHAFLNRLPFSGQRTNSCTPMLQAAEARMPDGQNSVELRFNMGVAYSGLANVVKEMETRNWWVLQ
jgi:hypothetical protein